MPRIKIYDWILTNECPILYLCNAAIDLKMFGIVSVATGSSLSACDCLLHHLPHNGDMYE